jgi:hypothetical protein
MTVSSIAVWVEPGATQLTRTPYSAQSNAAERESWAMAAFEAP